MSLTYRAYTLDDEAHFVALFADPAVARWMGGPGPDPSALFRRAFEPGVVTWDIWAILDGDTYIGHAEIKPTPNTHFTGYEIVYALMPSAWGRGLGREVASHLTDFGFHELGLTEVHATVDPANTRSLALLHRLGYADVRELTDGGDSYLLLTASR
jgi:ribosomal-protein-alanine N-acetyltransferase